MYKNKLQELAQRSCFNLPSYACIREGPDHAPRFKASVNFNGETYESPSYCSTLRQAEHSAAEVALNELASHGPTSSLAARILDETGVYKNLLQEISQRVGGCMPSYSTFRSGQGHISTFICTVELVGVIFTGDPAKSKKQAEKNAAMVAWLSLKSLAQQLEAPFEKTHKDEQEHLIVARALQNYLTKARLARIPLPIKFPTIIPRPSIEHHSSPTTSKILPLIYPKTATRGRFTSPSTSNHIPSFQKTVNTTQAQLATSTPPNEIRPSPDNFKHQATQKFPTASAPPYIPIGLCNPHGRVSPVVTVRNMVPVFSSTVPVMRPPTIGIALPVNIRQAVPVYAAPVCKELPITSKAEELPFARVSPVCKELPITSKAEEELPFARVSPGPLGLPSSEVFTVQTEPIVQVCGPPVSSGAATNKTRIAVQESKVIGDLKDLKI